MADTTLAPPARLDAEAGLRRAAGTPQGGQGASPGRRSRYFAENPAAPNSESAGQSGFLDVAEARTKRFALLDRLQRGTVSQHKRLGHCRRDLHGMAEWVSIVRGEGGSSYAGLQTCGSAWVCPVCSAKIRHERSLRLARCVVAWADQGGGLLFPTLTLAHLQSHDLGFTLGHLLAGWAWVIKQRAYRRLRRQFGIEHVVRAVEITYGRNGWHPHLHLLMFTTRPLDERDARVIAGQLFALWDAYVRRHGLRDVVEGRAVVVKAVDVDSDRGLEHLGQYLAKVQDGYGIARELVRGDMKRGRRKTSRSPFQIAEAAVAGNREAVALWQEYERVTKGRHVLDWTPGAKAALGWGEDLDDDQVAALDEDGPVVFDLTPHEWSLVVRYRRRGVLLTVADREGGEGVLGALDVLRRRDRYEQARAARKASR